MEFANREVMDLTIVDYVTKAPFMVLDYANTTATEVTGEAVYAYGGQGHPKRVVFHGDKGGTLIIETQMQTMKLYSFMTGADIATTAKYFENEEIVATEDGKLTIAGTVAEGAEVFVYEADSDLSNAMEGTYTSGTFTATGIKKGTKYYAIYMKNQTEKVQTINIKNTTFPKNFAAYGKTISVGDDGTAFTQRLTAYKLSPQPTFSLNFANNGEPSTVTITCDLLVDADGNLMDLVTEG